MWINPNHPNPPQQHQATAPQESGERVATFTRHGGEELRVNLAEYEGHPYLSLRVWAPGQDGQLWPVRGKGLTVKLREVAGLAYALTEVAGQLELGRSTRQDDRAGDRDHHRARDRRDGGERREGPPGPHSRACRPGSAQAPFEPGSVRGMSDRPEFDEFT
jgi:hypothetical protein